jgi:hypothetical protein
VLSAQSTTRAWQLRDRVSERERFFIDSTYDRQVTGDLEKPMTERLAILGGAREKLAAAPIGDIFVTDTVDQPTETWPRLQVVSVAPLLADAIQRVTSR